MSEQVHLAVPASLTQWRIWFDAQLVADPLAYNASVAYRLPQALDLDRFARALEAEIASHAELRYAFVIDGWALVKRPVENAVRVRRSEAASERDALEAARTFLRTPFDPERGVTVRAALFAFEQASVLVISCHHLVCDGESFDVLLRGASARFERGDFAAGPVENAYERTAKRPSHGQAAAGLPKRRDAPAAALVPADGTRGPSPVHGGVLGVDLSPASSAGLRGVMARFRVAPFCAFVAAFALAVRAVAPAGPVVASFPVTLRRGGETDAVGPFLTYCAVALGVDPARGASAFVKDVWAALLDAISDPENGAAARLLETGRPEYRSYSLSYIALARTMELAGVRAERVLLDPLTAKFALTASIVEDGGALQIAVQYATGVYERATVLRHMARVAVALEALAACADDAVTADLLPGIRQAGEKA